VTERICSIEGCGRKTVGRGWCRTHYSRWTRQGDPTVVLRQPLGDAPLAFLVALKDHPDKDKCVIWPFGRYKNGYCKILINRKTVVATRFFCRMIHGDPPQERYEATHSCGNGSGGCINPHHLRWRTPSENQAERVLHNTSNRGTRHGKSKLNDTAVLDIYKRVMSGESQTIIARDYGISQKAVSDIKRGRNWSWLTGATS
jgi:hypothetical protein